MFEKLEIDGSQAEKKYHVGRLSGKLIAGSDLSEKQVQELLNHDMNLSVSQADCVKKACARILQAKNRHEKVFVGGDYDADGICSTAIMKYTLDHLGIPNGYYIPDRFREGYGLKASTVQMAHEKGYSLIITVDNGVSAHEALSAAQTLGIDTIVTDHHVISGDIESDIVVHPDYMEEKFAYLSGAGVALEISRNLIGDRSLLNVLAGVAAVGDVMPLWRETRKLVLLAVDQLKKGYPKPLAALLYPGSYVDESSIGWSIVPKLNAVSRMHEMANVNTVVRYLLSENPEEIDSYAAQLNQLNDRRKKLSNEESNDAIERVKGEPFEVIYNPSYHVGICGITAGRICEAVHKPVLVLTDYGDIIKGSGRSVKGFDMFSFLSDIEGKAEFGGHEMACGISIHKDDFQKFCDDVSKKMKEGTWEFHEETRKSIRIHPEDVSFDSIMDMERLDPYPAEMLQPEFTVTDPVVRKIWRNERSVRYSISSGSTEWEACIFARSGIQAPQKPHELTGRLTLNRYRGHITSRMMVDDAD